MSTLGLIGRKLGMTRMFDSDGTVVPVTVIQAGPCTVLKVKTEDGPDGYNALQVAFGEVKERRVKKPVKGYYGKLGLTPKKVIREFRVEKEVIGNYKVGDLLDIGLFNIDDDIDVTANSKGRGFTGVIKRHNFGMPKATHGTHENFRHPGAIGQCASPARVFKGKKMTGRYGNERVTTQNLKILDIPAGQNILLVRGGVPGPVKGLVIIRKALKLHNALKAVK